MKLGIKKGEKIDDIEKLKKILTKENSLINVARKMQCGMPKLQFLMNEHGLTWNKKSKLSKYKFVTFDKRKGKYVVAMRIGKKQKSFGYFENEDEAGKVAMEKAKEYGKKI